MRLRSRLLVLATGIALGCGSLNAQTGIRVSERQTFAGNQVYQRDPALPAATHRLALTLAYFSGSDWSRDAILEAVARAAAILSKCGVSLRSVELVRIDTPVRYHYLDTPVSRELAGELRLPKPTVYFVTDTRHRPAFDAEAFGRANTRTRPELAGSVWVTRATRDLGIALAHELVHVLTDSGEHVDRPDNLMREETMPERTRLTDAQCARVRAVGEDNGMLHEVAN